MGSAGNVGSAGKIDDEDEMEREWSRFERDLSVSRDERFGGEYVRTAGGDVSRVGEGVLDTRRGEERDEVGRVERVRLSKKGGLCVRERVPKGSGRRA
jgi:hypothetical protein